MIRNISVYLQDRGWVFFFFLFVYSLICRFSLLTIQTLVFKLLVRTSEDCCAVIVGIRKDGGTLRTQLLQKAAPESSDLRQQICLRVKERMKMSSRAARTRSHNQVIEMSYSLAQTCREQRRRYRLRACSKAKKRPESRRFERCFIGCYDRWVDVANKKPISHWVDNALITLVIQALKSPDVQDQRPRVQKNVRGFHPET